MSFEFFFLTLVDVGKRYIVSLKNYTVYGIQCHLPFGRTFFSNFLKKIIDLIDHIDTREIYKGMKVIALYVDPNEGKK